MGSLKVGDRVLVKKHGYYHDLGELRVVTRELPTQFLVDIGGVELRFNRQSLEEVGKGKNRYIEPATPEAIERIAKTELMATIKRKIENTGTDNLSFDEMKAIAAILKIEGSDAEN